MYPHLSLRMLEARSRADQLHAAAVRAQRTSTPRQASDVRRQPRPVRSGRWWARLRPAD